MKRIFNFRPLFFIFLGLVLGIFLTGNILVSNYDKGLLYICLIGALIIIVILISLILDKNSVIKSKIVINRKYNNNSKLDNKEDNQNINSTSVCNINCNSFDGELQCKNDGSFDKKIINKNYDNFSKDNERTNNLKSTLKSVLIVILAVMLGACLVCANYGHKLNTLNNYKDKFGSEKFDANITAKLKNFEQNGNLIYAIFNNASINNQSVDGNILIIINNEDTAFDFVLGDKLSFDAKISVCDISDTSVNTNVLNDKIYFYGYENSEIFIKNGNFANIFEKIYTKTDKNLKNYTSGDNYSVLKALLLGDKSSITSNTYNNFKASGIAHILSVSGLHVGFVVLVLSFILDKLKVKRKANFLITTIFLLCYCALCNFSSSVVRASVMSICILLSNCIGEENDMLSSISFAGIILLFVNPFYLYKLGFKLSFTSVFGIIFLYKPLLNMFGKIKIPYHICSALSLTISCQLGTLPVIANQFGVLPVSSVIANIIVIPLFSAYFSVCFVVFIFSLILPISFVFKPLGFALEFFFKVALFFSRFGEIKVGNFSTLACFAYYFALIVLSQYNLSKFKNKIISLCCVAVIGVSGTIAISIQNNFGIFVSKVQENCVLITNEKQNYLFTSNIEKYEYRQIKNQLKDKNIHSINHLIVLEKTNASVKTITDFCNDFGVKNIYINNALPNGNITEILSNAENLNIIHTYNENEFFIENMAKISIFFNNNNKNEGFLIILNKNIINPMSDFNKVCYLNSKAKTQTLDKIPVETNMFFMLASSQEVNINVQQKFIKPSNLIYLINENKFKFDLSYIIPFETKLITNQSFYFTY